jgi:hypothetical protein
MSDFSALFYLLHSERRLVQQLFVRRHHPQGLSREAVLQWIQGDEDRIDRLLESGLLEETGKQIRLKKSVVAFLEAESDLSPAYRTATFLEELEDWDALSLQYDPANEPSTNEDICLQLLLQLRAWEDGVPHLIKQLTRKPKPERLTALKEGLGRLAESLGQRLVFRATSTLELAEKVMDVLELIPRWLAQTQPSFPSPLQRHVQRLRELKNEGLLVKKTNLEAVLEAENALLLQKRLNFQTQLAPRQVTGSRKRSLRGFDFAAARNQPMQKELLGREEGQEEDAEASKDEVWDANLNLEIIWENFQNSEQDLVAFLRQNHENWESLLMEVVHAKGAGLLFSGKWIKIGKANYPVLLANS